MAETFSDIVRKACEQPTLLEALTWIAIWETDRAVRQAREGVQYDTCFKFLFEQVFQCYEATQRLNHA